MRNRTVMLISNRVMHYRVPVYDYFHRRFAERGWKFVVRTDELEEANAHRIEFDFKEIPFGFRRYKAEIERLNPEVVILFLHLKDKTIWPLLHWLKARRTRVVLWSKAKNYDKPNSLLSAVLYNYVHRLCDGLIVYAQQELREIRPIDRRKTFVAPNTINFESYPDVSESREDIKRALGIPFDKVVLSVGRMGAGGGQRKSRT